MTPAELYEATRKWWVMGASRAGPRGTHRARLGLQRLRGVVRAVYRIEGWHEADDEALAGDPTCTGKSAFDGTPVTDSPYLHGDVTA